MEAAVLLEGALREIGTQLAAFIALLLAASALHKAFAPRASVAAAAALLHAPRRLAAAASAAALLTELIAAALLLSGTQRRSGALLGAFVLGSYLVALARALAQGRRAIDCGCHLGPSTRTLGPYDLARNGVLTALALASALIPAEAGTLTPRHLLAALALLALYAALDAVLSLAPARAAGYPR